MYVCTIWVLNRNKNNVEINVIKSNNNYRNNMHG